MEETDNELIVVRYYYTCAWHTDPRRQIVLDECELGNARNRVYKVEIKYLKQEQIYVCYKFAGSVHPVVWNLVLSFVIDSTNLEFDETENVLIVHRHTNFHSPAAKMSFSKVNNERFMAELQTIRDNMWEHPLVLDWKLGLALK